VVGVAAVAAGVAFAAMSPKALCASILSAARAQHSVHYVAHNVVGNGLITLTADVAATDGVQHIGLKVGKQSGSVTIRLLGQTAYIKGDALGLQVLQGLTKSQASKYAGQWISIPQSDKSFKATAAAVTLPSFIDELAPHGKLESFSGKIHGEHVVAVRGIFGKGKKRTVMAIAAPAKGKKLPLEADEVTPGQASIGHTVLSKWNESVQVTAPASSTPISTVRGS
jgi:hypothetical protein